MNQCSALCFSIVAFSYECITQVCLGNRLSYVVMCFHVTVVNIGYGG